MDTTDNKDAVMAYFVGLMTLGTIGAIKLPIAFVIALNVTIAVGYFKLYFEKRTTGHTGQPPTKGLYTTTTTTKSSERLKVNKHDYGNNK